MSVKPTENAELVECSVCLTEIPQSAATSDEAKEYVRYYCGIECYAQWHQNATMQVAAEDKDD